MTMPSLLPACVQATPEAKKMRPPHVPISSHKLRIGCVLGAGFDRRLRALRQVRARRLRPAGRLTCRVHWQNVGSSRRPRKLAKALDRDLTAEISCAITGICTPISHRLAHGVSSCCLSTSLNSQPQHTGLPEMAERVPPAQICTAHTNRPTHSIAPQSPTSCWRDAHRQP